MAITRRPLLTATAAGTLLCALWFVPTANATGDTGPTQGTPGRTSALTGTGTDGTTLADTGTGIDTTPYLIGGMAFLGIGAGFVAHSARRTGPLPTHQP
ncbi:hypothetical protein OG244_14420 [Streptomyces brevispora]|uniref:hypothetical protein n=1 Tax=Streptomyces brevispora TaxID=887462 RepID=UPI002E35E5F6|nr:hypothetical protein [Streptomyces brevispora]